MNSYEQSMTTEDKLKAIIEAQVKGGCDTFEFVLKNPSFHEKKTGISEHPIPSVLRILLDTEGCKAAYNDPKLNSTNIIKTDVKIDIDTTDFYSGEFIDGEINVLFTPPHKILEAWNSEKGNNYKAAINTAYELL